MRKTVVCGSRGFKNIEDIAHLFCEEDEYYSGAARGVDQLAKEYCEVHDLKFTEVPADWEQYGTSAGFIRNDTLLGVADRLIVLWDGKSKGTKHMIDGAIKQNILVDMAIRSPTNDKEKD